MDRFSVFDGWGKCPDIADQIPPGEDITDWLPAHEWHNYDCIGECTGLKVFQYQETGPYLVEFSSFAYWHWVWCDDWPSMMELYARWSPIVAGQLLTQLVEELEPVFTAAKDTDAWRDHLRAQRQRRAAKGAT
jgi:hypothetical protein